MTARADELEASTASDEALETWMRETVAAAHTYSGVTASMMATIDDPNSPFHGSCLAMRNAGARLLARAQADGLARADIDGGDLFAMIGALAWLADQNLPSPRADHLFGVITSGIGLAGRR